MNEAQTRKTLIDTKLAEAGWNINNVTQVNTEYLINIDNGNEVSEPESVYKSNQFSDYVLLGKNGKPIAIVEAKKASKDAELGREQAKQYCYSIQKQHKSELPFCL